MPWEAADGRSSDAHHPTNTVGIAGSATPALPGLAAAGFACGAGYCRLARLFLSNTANIGPSDKMLPWLLSDGAYKLAALPPSRNSALGQFSPSRNRRAKASNDTSPWMLVPEDEEGAG